MGSRSKPASHVERRRLTRGRPHRRVHCLGMARQWAISRLLGSLAAQPIWGTRGRGSDFPESAVGACWHDLEGLGEGYREAPRSVSRRELAEMLVKAPPVILDPLDPAPIGIRGDWSLAEVTGSLARLVVSRVIRHGTRRHLARR